MFAIGGASGSQIVARLGQVLAKGIGVVVRRPQSPQRQSHPPKRDLPIDEAEAFAEGQCVR